MSLTLVELEGISKRFVLHKDKSFKERLVNFRSREKLKDDFWALHELSMEIGHGDTLGLVGHNGSGKSTLLKIIGGIIEPTTGTVSRRGRMAALLELGAGFHQDLTGRENVYLNSAILGLSRKQTDKYFDSIVEFSGIEEFIDTQVKFYSSGMYVRLAFAVAVHVDPDLLLVDEVLAVGDEPFQQKCMDKIAEFQRDGRTIVLVSHSAEQVGALCDRVAVLDHGRLLHDGGVEEGLRVLRHGYESARLEHEHEKGEAPAASATIESIEARATTVGADGVFASGSDIVLTFAYDVRSRERSFDAGISIETAKGQPLYSISTGRLDRPIPTDPGRHEVEFVLKDQPFGAGLYVVKGSLVNQSGEAVDRMDQATTFEVGHGTIGTGIVFVDSQATVKA